LEVYVSIVVARLQQFLDRRVVTWFARPNEVIVRYSELSPSVLEANDCLIRPLFRTATIFFGGTLDLQAVFICSSQEANVASQ
jgi:hypothetical protein